MTTTDSALTTTTTTNGALSHDVEPSSSSPFDTSIFRSYLLALLPPVIGTSPAELQTLFDDEFDERVSRFATEGGEVIYVVKVKEESEGQYIPLILEELNS